MKRRLPGQLLWKNSLWSLFLNMNLTCKIAGALTEERGMCEWAIIKTVTANAWLVISIQAADSFYTLSLMCVSDHFQVLGLSDHIFSVS